MSKTPAGKRKKTDEECLSSIISEINTITSSESSEVRKTKRKSRPVKNNDTDIVIRRDETGQRIYYNRRLLSQSSWVIGKKSINDAPANTDEVFQTDLVGESVGSVLPVTLNLPVEQLEDNVHVNECFDSVEKDLEDIVEQCEEVVEEMVVGPTVWEKRIASLDENWESAREAIFHSVICSFSPPLSFITCCKCNDNEAMLRCRQCGIIQYLCVSCDNEVHQCQPLHDREVWFNGYFQHILPTQSVSGDGIIVEVGRSCPLIYPTSCLNCHGPTVKRLESSMVVLVTSEGRFDLNWFSLHCVSCPWIWSPISFDCIIQSGFWPGSPANVNYLFDQKLFSLWDAFRKQMPGSSQTAFIRSLEDLSRSKNRGNVINAATFRKAFAEWCYCQFELESLQQQDWRKCPPCSVDQHSCHIDGNHKVYRFQKVSRGVSSSYYCDQLIFDNTKVDSHIKGISSSQLSRKFEKEDNPCGDTHWKAAKAVSKSKRNQDETGLVVAGCRHSISQAALNMFRGEVYGYSHYLHLNFIHPNNVRFMWQDVICKYWPWAQRVTSEEDKLALTNTKPALSLMHGKSHSWSCQVSWSGRWQEGAAATAGEEVEQINGYLSRLGSTTKNMTASGREDCIAEHLLSWNRRKIINLPKSLVLRLKTTEKKLEDAKKDLETFVSELSFPEADINASALLWKRDVQQFAIEQQQGKSGDVGDFGELFLLHHSVKNAKRLTAFVNENDDQTQILTGDQQFHGLAIDKTKQLNKDMARLHVLKNRVIITQETTEEEILAQGKIELANVTLTKLQKLEMLYFSITRRTKEISSLADSSKRRSSMGNKCSKEKSEVVSSVEEFNSISKLLNLPLTSAECILAGNFPWSFGEQQINSQDFPVRYKAQVVEKFMLVERLKEEKTQIKAEMKNFLVFYLDKIWPSLRENKESVNQRIGYISNVNEPDDKYSGENENIVNGRKRYLSRTMTLESLQGLLAITNRGIAFAKSQIASGLAYFKDLDTSLVSVEENKDEGSGYEDDDTDSDKDWSSEDE